MSGEPGLHAARLVLTEQPDEAGIARILDIFEDTALSAGCSREGEDGAWVLSVLFGHRPDRAFLDALFPSAGWDIAPVPEADWLAQSYRGFPPFAAGNFFIYGSHYDGAPAPGLIPLCIDAATAFGSGEHPTTAGCLTAMQYLSDTGFQPPSVLDMGTGSGILAIAASKLWPCPVTAVDNDEEAVRVTQRHARMNGVAGRITAFRGDGFAAPELSGHMFELITANILAGPLMEMAPQAARISAPRGFIVLSGILAKNAEDVIHVYGKNGFIPGRRDDTDGWSTLILRRQP